MLRSFLFFGCVLPLEAGCSKTLGTYQTQIGSHCVHVSDKGAKGDDSHDDTSAIQAAIQEVADHGGGTVIFDAKTYRVDKLEITGDKIELNLPENGRVKFHRNEKSQLGDSLIKMEGKSHFAITGEGTWDGQGSPEGWWRHELKSRNDRPHMVDTKHADHCYFEKARFINCPGHCLEMYCDYSELSHVEILNPPSQAESADNHKFSVETPEGRIDGPSHNTDGVDVNGDYFYIHDCHISTGDDNVAIHTSHVLVENCQFDSGHGASVGSLGDNKDVRNITVRKMNFYNTEQGVRIKIRPGAKNSHIQDVHFEDLTMDSVRKTFYVDEYYDGKEKKTQFEVKDIHVERVNATGSRNYLGKAVTPGYMTCQPSSHCKDIHLRDISHPDIDEKYAKEHVNWEICNVEEPSFHNVQPKLSDAFCSKAGLVV